MALFTFNFDKRIISVFLTLLVGTAVFALYNFAIWKIQRDDPGGKQAARRFWNDKIYPKKKYNAVFLGDSRCMNGINPALLEKKMGKPVFNSGFLAGGLNKTIFEHVEKKLLTSSPQEPRCIIFAVTPHSMSTVSDANAHFKSLFKRKEQTESWNEILFKQFSSKEIGILWGDGLSRSICHENGWHELLRKVRARSQRNALRYYQNLLSKLKFSPETWNELFAQTEIWTKNNITVFAFYIPSTQALEKMELSLADWNLDKFKAQFRKSGGIFLEISDRESYNAYDAVHLNSQDAQKLSKDLAEKIDTHLNKK